MPWDLILAGIEPTPQGLWASTVAHRIARDGGGRCVLVHAIRDIWSSPASRTVVLDEEPYHRVVTDRARLALTRVLEQRFPDAREWPLHIVAGRPARVLANAAREMGADLVVVGASRHMRGTGWMAGRTAQEASRLLEAPLLVAATPAARFRRVLAAVDLSPAAGPTLAAAEAVARLDDTALRLMHVVEPLPFAPDFPTAAEAERLVARDVAVLEQSVWPLATLGRAERVVRRGPARLTIVTEAMEWKADLVVLGSHGRGWVDRMVLGSVTEGVLTDLPCSVLVVPVHAPAGVLHAG